MFLRERLLPFIRRSTPPHLDPEDILDDTFLGVWAGLARLRDDEALLAYARRIAQRLIERSRGLGVYPPVFAERAKKAERDPALGVWRPRSFWWHCSTI